MKDKYSRREALELGFGAAVLGACSQALSRKRTNTGTTGGESYGYRK